jgi:hypothetical protein
VLTRIQCEPVSIFILQKPVKLEEVSRKLRERAASLRLSAQT